MEENNSSTKIITEEQIKDVYNKLLTYCNRELQVFQNEKQTQIVNNIKDQIINEKSYDWNETSLTDYINAIIYMIKGQEYARTINKFSENYFVNQLQKDFGDMIHSNAVESLRLHKIYYKKISEERNLKNFIKAFQEKWHTTEGLWKQEYIKGLSKSYRGFKINVSYGVGVRLSNPNKSPYMTFLKNSFVTNKGIYPFITYLYRDELFEVGLGISRKNQPDVDANVLNVIENYQSENIDITNIDKVVESINNAIDRFEIILNSSEKNNMNVKQEEEMKKTTQPLNQILYGPPGTGKTYNTINKALEIIFEKEDFENTEFYKFDFDSTLKIKYKDALQIEDEQYKRKVLKGIFEHYVGTQIEFITFHQSYGYEEFIEGIKAIPVGEEGNNTHEMIYKVVNGVFKALVKECTSKDEIQENKITNYENSTIWKMSLGDSLSGEDKAYFEEAVNTDSIIMGYGGEINYSSCKDKKSIEQLNTHDTSVTMIHRFKNELKNNDILIISDGNRKFKAIVQVIGDYFYDENSDFKHKRKIKWLKKFTTSRHYHEISDRYFTQVTLNKPQGVNKTKLLEYLSEKATIDNSNKNYVLIIDEINRGNISKIFGELITLIEPTKRLGKEEQVKVRLPYSGDEFGVPSNLYIIGTMNTADRSIALMDTALRRRFNFEEMMPDLEVLEQIENIDGIDIKLLVESINKRIEYLYDRDHSIGHAYFMALESKNNIETLSTIFQNKIIPLLQEYFYDDWEKIRLVLGDNQKEDESLQFIKIKQGYNLKDLFGDKGLDSLDIDDESNIYEINKAAFDNYESYIKVYEK